MESDALRHGGKAASEIGQVVGDRTVGSLCAVKWGSPTRKETRWERQSRRRSEERRETVGSKGRQGDGCGMDGSTESLGEPAEVDGASRSKQAGEVRARWAWAEPCVWTNRMLTTLETGVKGGRWFSLVDKVWREDNLRAAFERVAANKGSAGVDHVGVTEYGERLDWEIAKLTEELRTGTYRPQPLKRVYINKPGSVENRPNCRHLRCMDLLRKPGIALLRTAPAKLARPGLSRLQAPHHVSGR